MVLVLLGKTIVQALVECVDFAVELVSVVLVDVLVSVVLFEVSASVVTSAASAASVSAVVAAVTSLVADTPVVELYVENLAAVTSVA